MNSARWLLLSVLVLVVVGLIALANPAPVAAAVDDGEPGKIAIPGVFEIQFGDGEGVQIALPAANSTVAVNGLTFGPGPLGWDTITLSQIAPRVSQTATISDAEINVHGPSTGFSTDASIHMELHPNPAVQVVGTFGINFDGLSKSVSTSISDAGLTVATAPVVVEVTGYNSQAGTPLAIDTVHIGVPATGADVVLSGFEVTSSGPNWESLTVTRDDMKLGNLATISGLQVNVGGPSTGFATQTSAHLALNAGNVAHVEGQLEAVSAPLTGQSGLTFSDGNVWVHTGPLNVDLTGVSYQDSGLAIENAALTVAPVGLEAEVDGLALGGGAGMTFDEARFKYTPAASDGGTFGGVEVVVTQSDEGYVITTQTILKPAAQK